jgi:hypothetical protein
MNKITATTLFMALLAWPGLFAHAQPASTLEAKPHQTHRAAEPIICCTHLDAGTGAQQPCKAQRANEAMRLGSDVTREEFECVLSGVCGVAERARVNG